MAANAVFRTYENLPQRGILYTRRGLGLFVASRAAGTMLGHRRACFLNDELPDFFKRIRQADIPMEHIAALYGHWLQQDPETGTTLK